MRLLVALLTIAVFAVSCNNKGKNPDVSNIKVQLTTQRFEEDLFKLNPGNFGQQYAALQAKYPQFAGFFQYEILGFEPTWPADSSMKYLAQYVTDYTPIYDSSEKLFANFTPYSNEIKEALQYVKYYFPEYKTPTKIVTFIGPLDGKGNVLLPDGSIGIGLQAHLGKDFSIYKSSALWDTYPEYITNRFEASYISINTMKNILDDIYPEKEDNKALIDEMIEKGKRLYAVSKFLPGKEEYKIIGYTEKQLKDSYKNEKEIWNMFVQNSFLQVTDPNIIKNYVEDSPKTQELDGAPGNLGSFAGWQIVKKYMDKKQDVTLKQLLSTNAETILQETKYKP